MKIGITGGIGSGKSYVCRLLTAHYGIEVYDCDAAAKRLMRMSGELRQQLTALVGPDCYLQEEQPPASHHSPLTPYFSPLNKAAVARFLLASEENAHAIDAIVHPAVFKDFEQSGLDWMESAILFESGANKLVDRVVVVTAPEETRISRVMQRDGISREKALEWMGRQWPQDEVRRRADFEICNDSEADLDQQIATLLTSLKLTALNSSPQLSILNSQLSILN
jgi:dephospho-CoA kinase